MARVKSAQGNMLIAAANAGTIIVAPRAGRKLTVIDCWMRALGGNATQCTAVALQDTTTATVAVSYAAAALTTAAGVVRAGAANTTVTNLLTALGASEGLRLITTGTDETTMTSIDYYVEYVES